MIEYLFRMSNTYTHTYTHKQHKSARDIGSLLELVLSIHDILVSEK